MEDKTAERQELSVGPLFSEDALQRLRDELSFRMMMDPLIAAVKAVLRHEMETDQPFRQPYHRLMQALVNVTGSDDLGDK